MLNAVTIGVNIGSFMGGASKKSRMENSVKNAKAQVISQEGRSWFEC